MFPTVAAISVPAEMFVGSAIANPQSATGAWEQRSGLGQAVGFDVEISTEVSGAPKSLTAVSQHIVQIWITTYVRTNGRSQRTFWSTGYAGTFSWRNDHLVFHQPPIGTAKAVSLDVVLDPQTDTWNGTLQNQWFSGSVALRRPFAPHLGYRIIGDWIAGRASGGGVACTHIALGADSSLVMWNDYVSLPGFITYGPSGTAPPPTTREWYGSLNIDPEKKDVGLNMLFFTGTDRSGAVVLGRVADDGRTFTGSSANFGNGYSNGAFNPFTWRRTTPDCSTDT